MNEQKNPFEPPDSTSRLDLEKHLFESHDLKSRFDLEIDPKEGSKGTGKYVFGERRYYSRRKSADRRTDIRFEIDKEGRRVGRGRRFDDNGDVSF